MVLFSFYILHKFERQLAGVIDEFSHSNIEWVPSTSDLIYCRHKLLATFSHRQKILFQKRYNFCNLIQYFFLKSHLLRLQVTPLNLQPRQLNLILHVIYQNLVLLYLLESCSHPIAFFLFQKLETAHPPFVHYSICSLLFKGTFFTGVDVYTHLQGFFLHHNLGELDSRNSSLKFTGVCIKSAEIVI